MSRYKTIYFIILSLLGLHCFFWLLYVKIISAGGLQRRKEALLQLSENQSADIWIMGDSHPMLAINPDSLKGAVNLAGTSEYYFLSRFKLRNALESGISKPRMIILPLDLHSFAAHGNVLLKQHELDDPYWSAQIGFPDIIPSKLPSDYLRWWMGARFFPYAGQYYRLFARLLRRDEYQLNAAGFAQVNSRFDDLSMKERKASAIARYKAHFDKYSNYDPLQLAALQEISKLCRKNKIRLFLLSFPLSAEYLKLAHSDARLQRIKALHKKIISNEIYLDYSHLFINKPEYFSDPDHLNSAGASLFSARLRREIDSLRKTTASAQEAI